MTKHRVDKAAELDDLLNRVREHWDDIDQKRTPPVNDGFDKRPAKLHGPAHRQISLAEAYDYNLVAAQFATVEAFGRKRKERPVVKSETTAGLTHRLPPQTILGTAALAPPSRAGLKGVPQWVRQEIAYEEAIAVIEDRARTAARNGAMRMSAASNSPGLVKKARAASEEGPGHVGTSDNQPDRFIPAEITVVEITDPAFSYRPGESFFESLAAGAQIVSGQGADFIDPETTATLVAFGRPSPV